ncbi:MAG: serine hydrolase [Cyanobacteria bacterium P01_F01_bin.150]
MLLNFLVMLIALFASMIVGVTSTQAQGLPTADNLAAMPEVSPTLQQTPQSPQSSQPLQPLKSTRTALVSRTNRSRTKWTGRISPEMNLGWASNRDLSSSAFSDRFKSYSKQGLMITDVDAYPDGKKDTQYAMIWQTNPDGRKWKEHRNMTSDGYNQKWKAYKDAGYRPLDVEVYLLNGKWRYAGIWVENVENLKWWSRRNMDGNEYASVFKEKSKQGYRLIDMEAYNTADGLRYSAIWYENVDNTPWAQLRNMTRERYSEEVTKKSADDMVIVDYESYRTDSGQRYAAIWEKNTSGRAWVVRTNRKEEDFASYWREYLDKGYRLIDFERYETPSGTRYGGVWAENNPERLRYARKGELDKEITEYRDKQSTKGISVAVIKDGTVLYRRGFGWADQGRNKKAWGGTIYNLASISKAVGGTLAAKLEATGKLENGRSIDLDLTKRTSSFISGLPRQHTHTVEQLFSHLACIPHYRTEPKILDTEKHYSTAQSALERFIDTDLVKDCQIGVSRGSKYSTPAFTFAGAVLEKVTGKPVDRLTDDEIIKPYGLDSMNVMYSSKELPGNYDRAKRYSGNTRLSGWPDTSWKVWGGGLESNPVDLARFGWKVLDGQIVSPSVRDNRLWKKVSPSTSYGVAWLLDNIDNRRTAEHGGQQTGARSYLRVYRDDGLVIAVLSNQSNHPIDSLVTALGNIVLR